MKTIDLTEVSALAHYVRSTCQPLIVTDNGETVAAVIPADEADIESLLLRINPRYRNILEPLQEPVELAGSLSSSDGRERLETEG